MQIKGTAAYATSTVIYAHVFGIDMVAQVEAAGIVAATLITWFLLDSSKAAAGVGAGEVVDYPTATLWAYGTWTGTTMGEHVL
jgi:hypothetical protein